MKDQQYRQTLQSIQTLIEGIDDPVAVMATVACELYHAFDKFNWVGFYRRVRPDTLMVGPYQGSHGCLSININRGVCGACVRKASIQVENDVSKVPDHIACSSETRAEIVLPVFDRANQVSAVLDIDALEAQIFDDRDRRYLARVCTWIPTP